ncbi:HNH endonuclease signature motif containing protein [Paenibacillus sp. strain BS8-2]
MSRVYRYTSEQIDYVREVAQGRYNDEIAALFNDRFGTRLNADKISSIKKNHKINSGVPRKRISEEDGLFTKEQKLFIVQNVKGRTNLEIAELVNDRFCLQITARQINTWKKNRKLTSGIDCRFKKGDAPANKGTKGVYNVGGNRTSFKHGQRAANYKPIGSESIDDDGYTRIKVSDVGRWDERWRHKHRVIWEEANGPIPDGYVLIFADQDRRNVTLDNLLLAPQSSLSIVNNKGLLYSDANLTRTGLVIAAIYKKIGERKRRNSRKA